MTHEQFEQLKKGQSIYLIDVDGLFEYKITQGYSDGIVVATNLQFRLPGVRIKEQDCEKFYDSAEHAISAFKSNAGRLLNQAKADTVAWYMGKKK